MSRLVEPPYSGYFRVFQGVDGGFVDIHETHGKLESRQNLPIALWLASQGEQVRLLPVHDLIGVKSPDATRDGVEWEFKVPESLSANAVDKALRGANRQAARVLLQLPLEFDFQVMEHAIHNRVRRATNLLEVAVFLPDVLHHFTRQEIISNTFRGKMV